MNIGFNSEFVAEKRFTNFDSNADQWEIQARGLVEDGNFGTLIFTMKEEGMTSSDFKDMLTFMREVL